MSRFDLVTWTVSWFISLVMLLVLGARYAHAASPTLREIITYDAPRMEKLVSSQMNMKEASDEKFMKQASTALQTALSHPRFTEREAAIREIRGKIDPDLYSILVSKTASELIERVNNTTNIAQQATAMVSLTNLVVEVKALKHGDLKETLVKIKSADIQISDEVRGYALEPLKNLISPSAEAEAALAAL